jgi:DnaK suppressor protein
MAQKKTAPAVIKKATRKPAPVAPRSVKSSPAASKSPASAKPAAPAASKLSAKEAADTRKSLLDMRERLSGQINALKSESLKRDDEVNTEEDGTDAFDRQFALNIASSENNSIREIDEALRRLDQGVYGICEHCSCRIERPRLSALPFVRNCVKCQSELEKQNPGFRSLFPREST